MLCSIAAVFYRGLPLLLLLLPADLTTVLSSEDSSVFWTLVYSVIYICVCVGHLIATFNIISSSLLHRSIVLLLFGSPLPSVPYLDKPREAQPLPRCQGITIYHNTHAPFQAHMQIQIVAQTHSAQSAHKRIREAQSHAITRHTYNYEG